MTDKKPIKAIIYYKDFLLLREEQKKVLFENEQVEFLISIKKEEYKNLSKEDKEKLYGFRRTIREPFKKPIINKEVLFRNLPEIKNAIQIEQSFKEKHKRDSKPYVPKNIINQNFSSKKKGGR